MGIHSVLNLRGNDGLAPWLTEEAACKALGLELHVVKLYARRASKQEELLRLIETFRQIPKPFVMHCKSGADRAGLASVVYQLVIEKKTLEEARKQLSIRFLHLESTLTGIVDHLFDVYEERTRLGPIDFEAWLELEYSRKLISRTFAMKRDGQDWRSEIKLPLVTP
ncbi:MAG: tyrosine-protein phosphatase [Pseudomonadota bacterium]